MGGSCCDEDEAMFFYESRVDARLMGLIPETALVL